MIAKMALPRLGGSPSVWNTWVLFFQTALLLGYLYAHLTVRWLGTRRQAVFHVALMFVPVLMLPLTLGDTVPPAGASPAWWLLLALLTFPFLIEPAYGVSVQASAWALGYLLLIVLAAACAFTIWKHGSELRQTSARVRTAASPPAGQRGLWVLLSFAPSSLMLGVTTHVSTDLAAVPLLWVLPLALYLATFIMAFFGKPGPVTHLLTRVFPLLALASLASTIVQIHSPYMIGLHLISFFAGALVCHRQLADRRPAAVHLTEFYLWLSFGGMLGGVFNTLVAPRVFKGVFEYPLVLALACLLRPPTRSRKGKLEPWPWFVLSGGTPLAVGAVMWGSGAVNSGTSPAVLLLLAAGVSGVIWALANRRAPFNVFMVAAALAPVGGATGVPGEVLFAGRSFFGVVRVIDRPKEGYHLLQHGTTVHGRQDTRVQTACAPLSYFHPSGPIGQVFAASASASE